MNFGALKGLIENVVNNYKCPECNSEINDTNIDVVGAAGSTVNIDIECTNCGKHSMIKSEIITFDLTKMPLNEDKLKALKEEFGKIKGKLFLNLETTIKDEDIVNLNKELKSPKFNVSDLLGDNLNSGKNGDNIES